MMLMMMMMMQCVCSFPSTHHRQQSPDGLRRLRAHADPVLRPQHVELDVLVQMSGGVVRVRLRHRVVRADDLERPAVPRAPATVPRMGHPLVSHRTEKTDDGGGGVRLARRSNRSSTRTDRIGSAWIGLDWTGHRDGWRRGGWREEAGGRWEGVGRRESWLTLPGRRRCCRGERSCARSAPAGSSPPLPCVLSVVPIAYLKLAIIISRVGNLNLTGTK